MTEKEWKTLKKGDIIKCIASESRTQSIRKAGDVFEVYCDFGEGTRPDRLYYDKNYSTDKFEEFELVSRKTPYGVDNNTQSINRELSIIELKNLFNYKEPVIETRATADSSYLETCCTSVVNTDIHITDITIIQNDSKENPINDAKTKIFPLSIYVKRETETPKTNSVILLSLKTIKHLKI